MWAYSVGNYIEQKKFSLNYIPSKGGGWWFKPRAITDLIVSLGNNPAILAPGEISVALTHDVRAVETLKEKLVRLYPSKKNKIYETFRKYGL